MATTTGDHQITPPTQSQATPWTSTFTTYAQAISNHLDNLADVQIDTIEDSNNNELLKFSATGSAVNYVQIANAATTVAPVISSQGDDLNVGLTLTPKGTGALVLGALTWPTADGTNGQGVGTNGAGQLQFIDTFSEVVNDTTPQLGGSLDVNGNEIQSVSGGDVDIHSDNNVILELGDAAGADKISVRDSAAAEVASVNSDGDIACTDITANSISLTTALAGSSVDINGTTEELTVAGSDTILIYDTDAGVNKKASLTNALANAQGAWTLLSTATPAGASSVSVELTGYSVYRLVGYDIECDTSGGYVTMQLDNAGTTVTSAYEWSATVQHSGGTSATGQSSSDTDMPIMGINSGSQDVSNEENNVGNSFDVTIFYNSATEYVSMIGKATYYNDNTLDVLIQRSAGMLASAITLDGAVIAMSTGNITGTIKVYGLI